MWEKFNYRRSRGASTWQTSSTWEITTENFSQFLADHTFAGRKHATCNSDEECLSCENSCFYTRSVTLRCKWISLLWGPEANWEKMKGLNNLKSEVARNIRKHIKWHLMRLSEFSRTSAFTHLSDQKIITPHQAQLIPFHDSTKFEFQFLLYLNPTLSQSHTSKLPHNIIHQIPSKGSPRTKHRRIPKLTRHIPRPFVMLFSLASYSHLSPSQNQKRKKMKRRGKED